MVFIAFEIWCLYIASGGNVFIKNILDYKHGRAYIHTLRKTYDTTEYP